MSVLHFDLIANTYDNLITAGTPDHPYKKISGKFLDTLSPEEMDYVQDAVSIINRAWLIYTAIHLVDLDRDMKVYNELIVPFNKTYGETFKEFPPDSFIEWSELFPKNYFIPFLTVFVFE